MIFLPNKYERYIAALRNYLHKTNIKYGLTSSSLLKYRKIYEFEAMYINKSELPCDIKLLSSKLLVAAYSKMIENNIFLDFSIKIKNNYILNIKLFTCLLLTLANISTRIKICSINGRIAIFYETENIIKFPFLKSLKAYTLFERKTKTQLIVINAEKTSKQSVDLKREWDIQDPFSPINLYLFK